MVDAQSFEPDNQELKLPPDTNKVEIEGKVKPGTPELSFEQTVENYKREYRQRYKEFLRTGLTR